MLSVCLCACLRLPSVDPVAGSGLDSWFQRSQAFTPSFAQLVVTGQATLRPAPPAFQECRGDSPFTPTMERAWEEGESREPLATGTGWLGFRRCLPGHRTGEPGASGGDSHKSRDDDVREHPWTRCPSRDICLWAQWTREGAGTGHAGTSIAQGWTPWPLCGGAGGVRGGSGEFGKSVETSRMPVLEEGGPGRAAQTDSCPQIQVLWSHCGSSSEMGSLQINQVKMRSY